MKRTPAQIRADLVEQLEAEALIPISPPPGSGSTAAHEKALRTLLGILADMMAEAEHDARKAAARARAALRHDAAGRYLRVVSRENSEEKSA